jgi:hypothetical protein
MRFIAIELDLPHGTVIMAAAPDLRAIAEAEVDRAVQRWRKCTQTGAWPLYPPHTAWVDAPGWLVAQADAAAVREDFMIRAEAKAYDPESLAEHPFPFV